MSDNKTTTTVGQEIIRTSFASNDEVSVLKNEFAKLYDKLVDRVLAAQTAADTTPAIHSTDTISKHMEVVRQSEELMRCMSEACKLLEQSAMFAVKAITS